MPKLTATIFQFFNIYKNKKNDANLDNNSATDIHALPAVKTITVINTAGAAKSTFIANLITLVTIMNPLIIQAVSISNFTLNKTTQPLSYNKVTLIDILKNIKQNYSLHFDFSCNS